MFSIVINALSALDFVFSPQLYLEHIPSSVYATITATQRLLFTPNNHYHQSSYSSPISIRLPRPSNRNRVSPGQYTDRYIHPVFATQQTAPSYFTTTTMSQNSATLTVVTSLETAIQLAKKVDILLERDAFALRLLLPLSDMTTKQHIKARLEELRIKIPARFRSLTRYNY